MESEWAASRSGTQALFVALQVLIILTGNYGFFNLLAIALTVPLLDDRLLRHMSPVWLRARDSSAATPLVWRGAVAVIAAFVLLLNIAHFTAVAGAGDRLLTPVRKLAGWVEPFHIVNSYGLFAVMTTSRPEIIVEGSADGREWRPYAFRYKPGEGDRAPPWVAPHQPRLDWQMWFAALGSAERAPWFSNFLLRLLQGSPDVLALLARNPFPDAPPRFVRAVVYEYRFTEGGSAWWRREPRGLYLPAISLE